jgi:hypothetical protein
MMETIVPLEWKLYQQVPSACYYYQINAETTWVFKRDVPSKLERQPFEVEEVVHILEYNSSFKDHSTIICTEEVKEEFKEILQKLYPKNRKLAISADRIFSKVYQTREDLNQNLLKLMLHDAKAREIYLFEEGRVYRLLAERSTSVKTERGCPCCLDKDKVQTRGSRKPLELADLAAHKKDCECCRKNKITYDSWRPANYLQKL